MYSKEAWICSSCEWIFNPREDGWDCPKCAKGPTYNIFGWTNERLAAINQALAFIKKENSGREDGNQTQNIEA